MSPRLILLGCLLPHLAAWAQPTVRIRDAGSCQACRIVLDPVVALGTDDGPGIITSVDAQAIRTRAGEYIVRGMYAPSLTVFGPTGRYRRTVGRSGGAPGEFRGIGSIASYRGDSLLVLDWGSRRFSVLDSTFAYRRGGPLPFTPGLATVAFADGTFVHHVHVQSPERVGLPLHRVSADGTWLRSFGSATGVSRPDVPLLMSRTIAAADAVHLWVAPVSAYEVEFIDGTTGRVVRRLLRSVPWFPDGRRPGFIASAIDRPPPPLLVALRQDAAGYLWVALAVPDRAWRTQVEADAGGHGFRVRDEQGYYDTILEVIEPSTGTLLASTRVGAYIRHFVDDAHVGTVIEDPTTGVPRLQVWHVRLVRE